MGDVPVWLIKNGNALVNCVNCTKKKHFVAKQGIMLVEKCIFVYDMIDYEIQKRRLYDVDLIFEHD